MKKTHLIRDNREQSPWASKSKKKFQRTICGKWLKDAPVVETFWSVMPENVLDRVHPPLKYLEAGYDHREIFVVVRGETCKTCTKMIDKISLDTAMK